MNRYGDYGRPIMLFEAWQEWVENQRDELGVLEEADSKADFPSWLWGPVRRAVWRGYTRIVPQYRRYSRVENMPDFRPRLMHGLNAIRGVGYVGDNGMYPVMRRSERGGPSLVIDTYGGMYGITRQAVINDDSGQLLNRAPAEMGEDMGIFVAEAIVALIESNPTMWDSVAFFHSSRGNTGTAALSEDAIADAITWMEHQTDDNGFRIRVQPRSLVVKTARMELIARRILNSQITGATVNYTGGTAGIGSAYFDKGTDNPLAGILPADAVVREPFMSDANDWYLFANQEDTPTSAVGFLNGREEPTVMLKDPGVRMAMGPGTDPYSWDIDSIDYKVRHDFGVAMVDPRGAYRSVVA